jgi:hypothetical protein
MRHSKESNLTIGNTILIDILNWLRLESRDTGNCLWYFYKIEGQMTKNEKKIKNCV